MRDNKFWKKVANLLKVYEPLVRVLWLVDGDDKPTMGYIYMKQWIGQSKLSWKMLDIMMNMDENRGRYVA